MVGSIDPRCETVRGTHWPKKVAWLFGARVAETILASDPLRPHQQAGHMDASDPIRPEKLLRHGGRPHMGPGSRSRSLSSGARSRDPLAHLSGTTWVLHPSSRFHFQTANSKYGSAISRRDSPEFCKNCFAALNNRGRGECRVPNVPA